MIIYRERANGTWEYWTYLDGSRHYLSQSFAQRELRRDAKLITV